MEECTKRLDQYLDLLQTRADRFGLEPEKRRRKPRNDRQSGIPEGREFEWLALWQTAGMSYIEIQERYRFTDTKTGYSQLYDESSIRKAIGTAAQRIGLTVRK